MIVVPARLVGDRVPALFPFAGNPATRPDVGQSHGQAGEFAPAGGLRKRPGRVVRAAAELPVGRIPGALPQTPEIGGEFGEQVVPGIQWSFRTRHPSSLFPPVSGLTVSVLEPGQGSIAEITRRASTPSSASRSAAGSGGVTFSSARSSSAGSRG